MWSSGALIVIGRAEVPKLVGQPDLRQDVLTLGGGAGAPRRSQASGIPGSRQLPDGPDPDHLAVCDAGAFEPAREVNLRPEILYGFSGEDDIVPPTMRGHHKVD